MQLSLLPALEAESPLAQTGFPPPHGQSANIGPSQLSQTVDGYSRGRAIAPLCRTQDWEAGFRPGQISFEQAGLCPSH
jgi:hypothetical protein